MGLFSRSTDRDEAMATADKITSGKGFTGRIAKAMMGSENLANAHGAVQAAQGAQLAAAAMAQGMPTISARVVAVADTGKLVNHDPVVVLHLVLNDGNESQIQLETLVSKLQIPRAADIVLVMPNAQAPQGYLYMGPAA
ncbi:hypothetical protein G7068_08815 [Leucobacter viscericola]|uniref:Uncharacterized protein n=1 Tax=Leucobacter viscericola TaxID=2714935 RepID=A0A6G7XFY5_9MICO|nr:hypothetical protein [Leucobacter viscericola]QIK63288.1 hypothetical protein G7068_08815 [Leucobacter viscericola]